MALSAMPNIEIGQKGIKIRLFQALKGNKKLSFLCFYPFLAHKFAAQNFSIQILFGGIQ